MKYWPTPSFKYSIPNFKEIYGKTNFTSTRYYKWTMDELSNRKFVLMKNTNSNRKYFSVLYI